MIGDPSGGPRAAWRRRADCGRAALLTRMSTGERDLDYRERIGLVNRVQRDASKRAPALPPRGRRNPAA